MQGITILDAFRALDDISDDFVEKEVKRVKLNKTLKESKEEHKEVISVDISGNNMYDKGQAYFYARTGDHVDINGVKFEIDQDDTHKIGYSDEILLKNLETGETSLIAKKDFIRDAQLLKEECEECKVEETCEVKEEHVCEKCGKNPCECVEKSLDESKDALTEDVKVNLMNDKEVEEAKELLHKQEEEHVEEVIDADAENVEDLKDSYAGDVVIICRHCKSKFYSPMEDLIKDESTGYFNVDSECAHCGAKEGFELWGPVSPLVDKSKEDIKLEKELDAEVSDEDKVEEVEEVKSEEEIKEVPAEEVVEEPKEERKKVSIIAEESLDTRTLFEKLEDLDESSFDTLVTKYLTEVYANVDSYKTTECESKKDSLIVEGDITFKSGKIKHTSFELSENKQLDNNRCRFDCINEAFSDSKKAFSLIGKVDNNSKLFSECFAYNYKTKKLEEELEVRGRVHI